jgi:hypothetical protein
MTREGHAATLHRERSVMSLEVIFIICAAMIVIGVASNIVTR